MFPDSFGENILKASKALDEYSKESRKTTTAIRKQRDALADLEKKQKDLDARQAEASKRKANISDAEYNILSGQTRSAKASATKASNRQLEVERQIQLAKESGAKTTKSGDLDARVASNKELLDSLREAQEESRKTLSIYEDLREKLSLAIPPSQIDEEQKKIQVELGKTKSLR